MIDLETSLASLFTSSRTLPVIWWAKFQKNPRAHKNKIGTPPPPQNPPPPKKGEFYGHGFSCRKNAFFPRVHKIGAPISGPRIADTNFTDTRIFLTKLALLAALRCIHCLLTSACWHDFSLAFSMSQIRSIFMIQICKTTMMCHTKRSDVHRCLLSS